MIWRRRPTGGYPSGYPTLQDELLAQVAVSDVTAIQYAKRGVTAPEVWNLLPDWPPNQTTIYPDNFANIGQRDVYDGQTAPTVFVPKQFVASAERDYQVGNPYEVQNGHTPLPTFIDEVYPL